MSCFPKSARLLKSKQFKEINHRGKRHAGSYLFAQSLSGSFVKTSKLGLTVSRKYGKAHERNRFKRLVREAFRLLLPEMPLPTHLNIQPKKEAMEASLDNILGDLRSLIKALA